MRNILIPVVEGPTEKDFYDSSLNYLIRATGSSFFDEVKPSYIACGIGNFAKYIPGYLNDEYFQYAPQNDDSYYVAFCYDKDVFKRQNPPVNWKKVESKCRLKFEPNDLNRLHFIHIVADDCIENVFLCDIDGICNYLGRKPMKIPAGSNGVEKMEKVFRTVNKFYVKGGRVDGMVSCLNIAKILRKNCDMFYSFCRYLSTDKHCDKCIDEYRKKQKL